MSFVELFILAVGLAMDTFAVGICAGLTMAKVSVRKALTIGLYFGIFQAGMPVIGYFLATTFADKIIAYDHWVAFGLLSFIGGKMILDGLKKEESSKNEQTTEFSTKPSKMLPLAIATSIDALAVGVSFAFLQVKLIPAVTLIGLTTLVISIIGIKIGNIFGIKFKSKAQFAGGAVLILIGLKILLEHLEIISF